MQTIVFDQHTEPFWNCLASKYAGKPIRDPVACDEKPSNGRRLPQTADRILEIGGAGGTAPRITPGVSRVIALSHGVIEIVSPFGRQRTSPDIAARRPSL